MNVLSGHQDSLPLRSGLHLYPSHEKALDELLVELSQRCPSPFLMLVETSGQLLTFKGERGQQDLVGLASLIAGDLAASQEIARMTGEYGTCQLILREGTRYNTFISEAGRSMALFAQVGRDVPLGWARLLILEASAQAAEIASATPEQVANLDLGLDDAKLSDLVGDALDALWNG